jgi:hypothetical protein
MRYRKPISAIRSKYSFEFISPKYAKIEPKIISTGGVGMRIILDTKGVLQISRERVRISTILLCITRCCHFVS